MATKRGTAGNDSLTGTTAADSLIGLAGNDVLIGNAGNDTLDGGTGDDDLRGGAGNDTYLVDHVGDITKTLADSGIDHVKASLTYTLGAQQENLTLTGTGAFAGTGNSGANTINGNAANNTLNGGAGNDILKGNNGNDKLNGSTGADFLNGGAGNDTLTFDADDTAVQGSTGTDTAFFTGTGFTLTAAKAATFTGVEVLSMNGAGANAFELSPDLLVAMSDTDILRVDIGADDTALLFGTWVANGTNVINNINYARFEGTVGAVTAVLQVQTGATVLFRNAPVLDANAAAPALPAINEDAGAPTGAVGLLVSSIVALGGNVSDLDPGAVTGIAVSGVSDSGTLWFSLDDGASWVDAGTALSDTNALLLGADAGTRVFFQPLADVSGTITDALTFRAWDRVDGNASGTAGISVGVNGGTSAYSAVTDTVSIVVNPVNDAPTATNLTQAKGYVEDTLTVALDDIVVTDVDAGETITATLTLANPATGALTTGTFGAATSTYTGGTGVWTVTGTLADVNAALAAVAYSPAANNDVGTTISTLVRDGSNTGPVAGTITLTVTPLNDAPVLAAIAPALASTNENANSANTLVSALLGTGQTDVDTGALEGIAIISTVNAAGGKWQFSTNGGSTFNDIGAVSGTSALLLRATDLVRYVPDGNNGETARFDFRGWDQTSGTFGTKVDVSAFGGASAFSSGSAQATITVTGVNDAPTASSLTQGLSYTEGQASVDPSNIVVADVDTGDVITATLTLANTAAGTLSGGGGTYNPGTGIWTFSGSVTAVNTALAGVVFVPATDNDVDTTITTQIRDAANAGPVNGTITLDAQPVNDAPVLAAGSPTLTGTDENTTSGSTLVSTLLGTRLTDADSGALEGIAVTGFTGLGTWQYSIDGGSTFLAMNHDGGISAVSARLLRDTDRIRYIPNSQNGETATITFVGWDQTGATLGQQGNRLSTTPNGGATPYSTASNTASIAVTSVNDAPTATNLTPALPVTYSEGASILDPLVADIVVTDVDSDAIITATFTLVNATTGSLSGGGGTYNPGNGQWTFTGSVAAVNTAIAGFRFTPNTDNDVDTTITTQIRDQNLTGPANGTITLDVTPANDAPTATNLSNTVLYTEGAASVALTDIVVTDVDTGETITATLTLAAPAAGSLTTSGTATYTAGTGVWTITGTVSAVNAALAAVAFVPATDRDTSTTITTQIRDAAATGPANGTITLNVTAVNDAPVLTPATPTFTGITENEIGAGTLVSTLVGASITDVDTGAAEGIAITGLTGTGWEFSTNGVNGTYTSVGAVSNTSALLLRAADALRYNGDDANGETATITYRAWDTTSGAFGTKVTTATNGGATAFSTATDTASITVTPVNDAPTATNLSNTVGYSEGAPSVALNDIVVTDVDSGDTITATLTLALPAAGALTTGTFGGATSTYTAGTGVWTVTGSVADVNAALAAVAFQPATNNDVDTTIATLIRDGALTGPAAGTITLDVTPSNDAPTASNLSQTRPYTEDPGGNVALDDIVVTDVDTGAVITATLTLAAPAAGVLTTGTFGATTSTYVAGTGVWTATGTVADVNAALAAVAFTPAANNDVSTTIATQIRDQVATGPANGSIALNVTPVDDPVVATDDGAPANGLLVNKNTGRTLDVLGNDVNPDTGDTLTITHIDGQAKTADDIYAFGAVNAWVASAPASGTAYVTVNPDGSLDYQSNGQFDPVAPNTVETSFTYTVDDGHGNNDTATVTVTIADNIAPTATNLSQTKAYAEGALTVALDDIVVTDPDAGQLITATLTLANPQAGTLSVSGAATYDGGTGVWTITGTLAAVNAALAAVAFAPATNNDVNTTVATHIVDAFGAGPADGTINLNVTAANDAPTATNLGQTLNYVEGDASVALTDIVVTDVDTGDTITATLTLSSAAAGTLTTAGGGSFNAGVWTVTGSVATVNAALAAVAFVPATDRDTNATITTQIRDAANAGPTNGTVNLNVTAVNDAPVLDNTKSPALTDIAKTAGAPANGQTIATVGATLVSALVDFASPAGQVDNVTDPDTGALPGIAITGANASNGVWWFTTNNGTNWTALGAVSDASARLLAADADNAVFFQPTGGFVGTVSDGLTVRAWDRSSGTDGGTGNASTNGGATAFSGTTDTVAVVVAAVPIARINLVGLNGGDINGDGVADGFKITGVRGSTDPAVGDQSGISVSIVGDANGDGLADILIGSSQFTTNVALPNLTGAAHLVFGDSTADLQARANGTTGYSLAAANGVDAVAFIGDNPADRTGVIVNALGDMNHDGFADLAIGQSFGDEDGTLDEPQQAYLLLGDDSSALDALHGTSGFDLGGVNGTNGANVFGGAITIPVRLNITGIGDIDGDGHNDFAVSQPTVTAGATASGKIYVVFGNGASTLSALDNFNLVTATPAQGVLTLQGPGTGYQIGRTISNLGDVNGDGLDDLLIGARGSSDLAGRGYVLFGDTRADLQTLFAAINAESGAFAPIAENGATLNREADGGLELLNGSNGGFLVTNNWLTADAAGLGLSKIGDFNGDGYDDFILSGSGNNPNHATVVFGRPTFTNFDLDDSVDELLELGGGFRITSDNATSSFPAAGGGGDVNGDGFDDLILGETGGNRAVVLFGTADVSTITTNPSIAGAQRGPLVFVGSAAFNAGGQLAGHGVELTQGTGQTGTSVAIGGDVNGDGYDDILVGAPRFEQSASERGIGQTYVVYGQDFSGGAPVSADNLVATANGQSLVGSRLGDQLSSGTFTGITLRGGNGDDLLTINGNERAVDGGGGLDSLLPSTNAMALDFTTIDAGRYSGIEQVDLRGQGNNALTLDVRGLLELSDTAHELFVRGDAGDSVVSTGQGWSSVVTDVAGFNKYVIAGSAALLYIETDVTQTLVT